MNSPIEAFFKLGDKVTKGDPVNLIRFNYYLMWIMFIGFLIVLFSNIYAFYNTTNFTYLGWTIVVLAILWFQYNGLKQTYEAKKMMTAPREKIEPNELNDMMSEFLDNEESKDLKGGTETK